SGRPTPPPPPTPSGTEPPPVAPAEPPTTTASGPTRALSSGARLNDSATLAGGFNPTGTITFTLTLSGATVYTNVVPVNGNGTYDTSQGNNPGGYLPAAPGTYQWVGSYSGDPNNDPVASELGDEPQTVITVAPTITTTPGPAVALRSP